MIDESVLAAPEATHQWHRVRRRKKDMQVNGGRKSWNRKIRSENDRNEGY